MTPQQELGQLMLPITLPLYGHVSLTLPAQILFYPVNQIARLYRHAIQHGRASFIS
jgi:hypothetical protein